MYCETYHCKMTDAACVARQNNAQSLRARQSTRNVPGASDINCKDCAQGQQIAAAIDPAEVDRYSKGLRQVRSRARARKFGGEKKEKTAMTVKKKAPEGMKICSRKKCAHQGEPQPIGTFGNNKSKPDGKQDYCKDCMRDVARECYRRKKKSADKKAPIEDASRGEGSSAHDALQGCLNEKPALAARLDRLTEKIKATSENYADGGQLPPGQKADSVLATLFADTPLTLWRLHCLAYRERRTARDQIFAMVEQATPELDPNKG